MRAGDWLAERTLGELQLRKEGAVVLGITLGDGTWVGSPTFETRIHDGERVVIYAPAARLGDLDRRRTGSDGDEAHRAAVAEHRSRTRQLEQADVEDPVGGAT